MSRFIIEMGSGNTCRNDSGLIREMIDAVSEVDTGKHEVILKWQLFESAPPNVPLDIGKFAVAYSYASSLGYETTASVFDTRSIERLASFRVPFTKIACVPKLYGLIPQIKGTVYVSVSEPMAEPAARIVQMACVRKYPASASDYQDIGITDAVSDHTVGWNLYRTWRPTVIEKHFVLRRDKDNPDAGPFAVTPAELSEVL